MSVNGYLRRFRERVVLDAILEALPHYWEQRAAMFEWAMADSEERITPAHHVWDQHYATSGWTRVEGGWMRRVPDRTEADEQLRLLAEECHARARRREKLDAQWWGRLIGEILDDTSD